MKIVLGENYGNIKEMEVKTLHDIENYLKNERHGEYVRVRYFDDDGNEIKNYTVRCWYNNDEDCTTIREDDGKRCYDWNKSQDKNARQIFDYLVSDGVAMDIIKATMPTRYNSLRDLRYKNGDLTQEEMAKRIGISKAAYCNIERGVRFGSVATWEKIQTLFNLTDDEVWKLIKKKNK